MHSTTSRKVLGDSEGLLAACKSFLSTSGGSTWPADMKVGCGMVSLIGLAYRPSVLVYLHHYLTKRAWPGSKS